MAIDTDLMSPADVEWAMRNIPGVKFVRATCHTTTPQTVQMRCVPTATTEARSQILRIPMWHPTPLNRLTRGHWTNGHKNKKQDAELIASFVDAYKITPATRKRRVTLSIVLAKGQRSCDPDAYWKSLLDALVHARVLRNDSADWVELAPVQFLRTRAKDGSTIIELTDI